MIKLFSQGKKLENERTAGDVLETQCPVKMMFNPLITAVLLACSAVSAAPSEPPEGVYGNIDYILDKDMTWGQLFNEQGPGGAVGFCEPLTL